ncbi:MAG: hypothetical protein JXO22_03830 [Phycisphaerae bacterium]|nr:hypothetical protein [Phycisphaerae bacterium]
MPCRTGKLGNPHVCSRGLILALLLLVFASGGCAGWGYRSIKLGHGPRDYDGVLPQDQVRVTESGFCHVGTAKDRTEALAVQLTDDRRVAGKWSATLVDRQRWPRSEHSYHLVGEFSPTLAGLDQVGPLDVLRDTLEQLGRLNADPFVNQAHAWIAAGMFRIVERWHGLSAGVEPTSEATECLAHTVGDGVVRITIDPAGVYHIEYLEED